MAEQKSTHQKRVEAGEKGGERTAETHGKEFYQEIGRKGGEKVAEERGSEFYSEIGEKGAEAQPKEAKKKGGEHSHGGGRD
mgnify:CR=1 FL=1